MHRLFENTFLGRFLKLMFFAIFVVQSESSKVSFLFLCCQSWLNFVILFSIQRAGWPTCRCLDWKWNHFTRSTALHFYLNSLQISNGNVNFNMLISNIDKKHSETALTSKFRIFFLFRVRVTFLKQTCLFSIVFLSCQCLEILHQKVLTLDTFRMTNRYAKQTSLFQECNIYGTSDDVD